MSQIGVLVQVTVKPGRLEHLRQCFKDFFEALGQEAGLEYRQIMIDRDDNSKIFIFETWRSQKDFDNHLTHATSRKFYEDIDGDYDGTGGFIRSLVPFI